MGPSHKRLISGISVFAILLGISVFAFSADAQHGADVILTNLQANPKLHAPDDILADFVNGELETSVIVLLQPTAAAKALAVESQLSVQAPTEFTGPGAATYYNLQDEFIRSQLQTTVTETVNRLIGQLGATGMTVTQRFSYQFGFAAEVTPAALERIVNSPDVVAVEKDHILHPHLAQGIPLMHATTARNMYPGSGVSIAICDSGIDTSHPRLGGGGFPNSKVIGGYDTGDNDADPRPDSASGQAHGTACAGIAAGDTGAVGDYIGGVAPWAKLYAVKITTGNTGSATTSAMIAGWEWCITHKNDDPDNPILIISTSLGGGKYSSTCDLAISAMTTAAANAVAAGITIFASSGNDGYCDSISRPACISYVNSVGAVYDAALGTYGFCVNSASCATKQAYPSCSTGYVSWDATASDRVTCYSNSASFLTLFAPSHNAYTADIVGSGGYSSGDYFTSFGGTSAACPYAAGAAAVLQQASKAQTGAYLTPAQIKTYLVNNGDNVTDGKVAVTKPRINLSKAVDALTSLPGTIQLSSQNYSVNESGGSVLITVTRIAGSIGAVGISYATSNGSATAGSDYTSTSGTLSWADGDYTGKTLQVPITNDALDEPDETFTVMLSGPTGGAALGSPSSAIVTITDDDLLTVTVAATDAIATEAGPTPGTFRISRTGSTTSGLSVYLMMSGTAVNGSDYNTITSPVTIPAGALYMDITLTPINDSTYEGDEAAVLTLSANAAYQIGSPGNATITIQDDDLQPSPTPPSAPTNVSASDGTYIDRVEVTWAASSGATSYTVYRAASLARLAKKIVLGTTSGTFFNDTTAIPGRIYYYWVRASNAYGTSGFSAYDAGKRSDGRPPAPTNVSASDGTYVDRVEVTWTASPVATSYTVYRAASLATLAKKIVLGTTSDTLFNDTSAIVGRTYYYWVRASNAHGTSGFSAYNAGKRSDGRPLAPTNVSASDGTYVDRVEVTWAASPEATSYTVYRAPSLAALAKKAILGTTSNTLFNDTTAIPGRIYYYWIRASNAYGMSTFSAYNAGKR